jgi:hypothetical protein
VSQTLVIRIPKNDRVSEKLNMLSQKLNRVSKNLTGYSKNITGCPKDIKVSQKTKLGFQDVPKT